VSKLGQALEEMTMQPTVPADELIRRAVDLACRAPSVHNTQPWCWSYDCGVLDLRADFKRRLASTDPSGRQLIISCGAALHHLSTALTALGWMADIRRLPDRASPSHLAQVRFHQCTRSPQPHDLDLLSAIRLRYSDRRPFDPADPNAPLPASLKDTVRHHGVHLTILPHSARPVLAAATEITGAARRFDVAYQTELYWWAGHSLPEDGIQVEALATAENQARVDIGRQFPVGSDSGSILHTDQSTVLVLSTDVDEHGAWLRTGEALSAVLLEATATGHATCPLTHMTESAQSREMIGSLLPDSGVPQVLIRIGSTDTDASSRQTPRRPIESVLTITPRPGQRC
jgi:nitroreductase